jgi:hypothetical protein
MALLLDSRVRNLAVIVGPIGAGGTIGWEQTQPVRMLSGSRNRFVLDGQRNNLTEAEGAALMRDSFWTPSVMGLWIGRRVRATN